MKRHSILPIIVLLVGTITACSATEKAANEKPASAAERHQAFENKTAENKSAENKSIAKTQSKSIEIFDGRNGKVDNAKLSEVDLALVEADVRKKSQEDFLKKQTIGSDFNWKEEFKILDVAEGSFTAPNSDGQRAVLYRYSYTNGVVILSDGDIVAHYSGGPGDYAFYTAIKSLPDVNQNGLSELILFRNVEDNEDIIPYFFELKDSKIKFLGEGAYFESGYAAGDEADASKAKQTAYRLTVEPGKNPTFSQDIYERTGDKGVWKLTKKADQFSWKTRDDDVYDLTKI